MNKLNIHIKMVVYPLFAIVFFLSCQSKYPQKQTYILKKGKTTLQWID